MAVHRLTPAQRARPRRPPGLLLFRCKLTQARRLWQRHRPAWRVEMWGKKEPTKTEMKRTCNRCGTERFVLLADAKLRMPDADKLARARRGVALASVLGKSGPATQLTAVELMIARAAAAVQCPECGSKSFSEEQVQLAAESKPSSGGVPLSEPASIQQRSALIAARRSRQASGAAGTAAKNCPDPALRKRHRVVTPLCCSPRSRWPSPANPAPTCSTEEAYAPPLSM